MKTAEWKCTQCGVTNRKLLPDDASTGTDRCVTCGTRHAVTPGARPTFWEAVAQS